MTLATDKSGQDTQRLAPARAFSAPDELVLAGAEVARTRPEICVDAGGQGGAEADELPNCAISQTGPAPITLVLPYPISANRYWTSFHLGNRIAVGRSNEANAYKRQVAKLAQAAGISKPISGRVQIDIRLWPARPQDWAKRYARDPFTWDDTVRCLDLDNANKVLLDALKGIALDDDKWVRRMTSERMQPDGGGARVAVRITPLVAVKPQGSLL
ncbi:RusA family crossover junction endodeoxyribonuclease [Pigmentiphaga sp. CHJ604]|uniref:RusA family crossover junction endodeoxyribonuclease n=1 Tax=Pigmentiphaga sp. CHJ604 TaxID=3081984 RepID=UPI0030D183D3